MNPRAITAKHLKNVLADNDLWEPSAIQSESAPLIRHYGFSVLRHYYFLEELLQQFLKKPLKAKDYDIKAVLMIGLMEIWQDSNKPHAIVNESVKAILDLKKTWAKGLVNSTLRTFIRERDQKISQVKSQQAIHQHPKWLLKHFKNDWPDDWQKICEANNERPPMTLRINQQQTQREEYLTQLQSATINASALNESDQAIALDKPIDVDELPGFAQGVVSVQDLSAQFASSLLDLTPDLKVLDACAAPGGKSAHILETQPKTNLTALELNPNRIEKLEATLARLKLSAKTLKADASLPNDWWDGELFDRIILDAPCTGSGVIRRHPDIKVRLSQQSLEVAMETQQALLEALWPLLKPNGIFLYCTCSVFKEENTLQIERFLKEHSDAQPAPIDAAWGIAQAFGRQILPENHHDGFYYAKLIKSD